MNCRICMLIVIFKREYNSKITTNLCTQSSLQCLEVFNIIWGYMDLNSEVYYLLSSLQWQNAWQEQFETGKISLGSWFEGGLNPSQWRRHGRAALSMAGGAWGRYFSESNGPETEKAGSRYRCTQKPTPADLVLWAMLQLLKAPQF